MRLRVLLLGSLLASWLAPIGEADTNRLLTNAGPACMICVIEPLNQLTAAVYAAVALSCSG